MEANEYQRMAHEFATYGHNPMYPAIGLAEEAGEVCGKLAKYIRNHDGAEPANAESATPMGKDLEDAIKFREDLEKELGDVCWMVAELCTVYGLTFNEELTAKLDKLTDRKKRGVIVGEGDNR